MATYLTVVERDSVVMQLDAARTALQSANTIQETKRIVDIAGAAEIYAKRQKLSQESIDYAHTIKVEALAQLGRMLKEMPKATGTRGQLIGRGVIGSSLLEPPIDQPPTLADLGLDKKTSSLAQQIADLSKEELDQVKDATISLTQAKRNHKEKDREKKRAENREQIAIAPEMPKAAFSTILIDPPWDWGDEGDNDQLGRSKPTYGTMSLSELLELPVNDLADTNCHLYLWITNRSLPKGFQLIERWGFRYITCLTWCKPSFGLGNYFRGQTEHILFAVKGSQALKRKDVGTWFSAARGHGHSSKPTEAYDLIESCSPGPYLEMFARHNRLDWTSWGAEA